VAQLPLPADRSQIKRSFDGVIDVHADAEDVGEHGVAARELQHSHAEGRRKRVGDDCHTAGCRSAVGSISTRPRPIHTKSRTRPTIEVYKPSCGSIPKRAKRTKYEPSRAPSSNGTRNSTLPAMASSPPSVKARR